MRLSLDFILEVDKKNTFFVNIQFARPISHPQTHTHTLHIISPQSKTRTHNTHTHIRHFASFRRNIHFARFLSSNKFEHPDLPVDFTICRMRRVPKVLHAI